MTAEKLNWDDAPVWATHQLQDGAGVWRFVEYQSLHGYNVYLGFFNYPTAAFMFTENSMVFGSLEVRPAVAPKRSRLRSMLDVMFTKKTAEGASQ